MGVRVRGACVRVCMGIYVDMGIGYVGVWDVVVGVLLLLLLFFVFVVVVVITAAAEDVLVLLVLLDVCWSCYFPILFNLFIFDLLLKLHLFNFFVYIL